MNEAENNLTPPYVGYASFKANALELNTHGRLPIQVDSSVLANMSGSTRTQFVGALRYLGLISEDKRPTPDFTKLVSDNGGTAWRSTLASILCKRYKGQMAALEDGTITTLQAAFGDIGSIRSNAMRFLIFAARDAGLPIAPHIANAKVGNPSGPRKSKKVGDRNGEPSTNGSTVTAAATAANTGEPSLMRALIDKFPAFDPKWDADERKAWIATYQQLLVSTGVMVTPANSPNHP